MAESGANLIWNFSVFLFFLLDWATVLFNWHRIRALTKMLAMGSVIAWTLFIAEGQINGLVFFLISAQLFGLLGDFFLLLQNKWFLWGLGAFLAGHLLYLALFLIQLILELRGGGITSRSIFGGILVLVGWSLFLGYFYRLFKPLSDGKHIWRPIQVYAWSLSGMAAAALILVVILSDYSKDYLLLPIGAVLFTISDLLLAYSRFIKPVQNAKLLVRITYHLAQFSLAWGFFHLLG